MHDGRCCLRVVSLLPWLFSFVTYLVVREDECICYYHILPSTRSKDNHFGNILWRQSFNTFVNGISLGLVAAESDK